MCTLDNRLPYYMVYPIPPAFDDERVERVDFAYLKSMYPAMAKQLLPIVEEECDRMEYEGSMIYDEYPDQLQLRLLCRRVSVRAEKMELQKEQREELIQVLVYQELYQKRCKHRKQRRNFYLS